MHALLISLFCVVSLFFFFFFNDTATTEIYTLSLHDALPICLVGGDRLDLPLAEEAARGVDLLGGQRVALQRGDRKSTRLNSSHGYISYAVFCLKKKKNKYSRYNFCRVKQPGCA